MFSASLTVFKEKRKRKKRRRPSATETEAVGQISSETRPKRRWIPAGRVFCFFSPVAVCQAQRDIIFELRRIAFDVECDPSNSGSIEKRKSMYTRDYKKLGFIVGSAPSSGLR